MRIFSDQAPRALFQHLPGPAFADAGDARIRLHRNHQIALVEQRIRVRRSVDAYPRDFHFRNGRPNSRQADEAGGRRHCQ